MGWYNLSSPQDAAHSIFWFARTQVDRSPGSEARLSKHLNGTRAHGSKIPGNGNAERGRGPSTSLNVSQAKRSPPLRMTLCSCEELASEAQCTKSKTTSEEAMFIRSRCFPGAIPLHWHSYVEPNSAQYQTDQYSRLSRELRQQRAGAGERLGLLSGIRHACSSRARPRWRSTIFREFI